MWRLRQRAARLAGVLSLVALLLVPLALASHVHADPVAARSCAACVAVHHSPAVRSPAPALAAGLAAVPVAAAAPARPAGRVERSAHAGRAPPSSPLAVA
ncbi:MAG TPA: hypothetical protein VKW76_09630 [Candidatus Binatia bacterium]|nr:hypothetical protein [Candidatus Binatia bacterium]